MVSYPKYAMLMGHKVRIVEYNGHDRWLVVDHNDQYRVVNGFDLMYLKELGGSHD